MKESHGLPRGVLRGLQADHPVVKRAAVQEAFRTLGQHCLYQSRDGAALLQQCISSHDTVGMDVIAAEFVDVCVSNH